MVVEEKSKSQNVNKTLYKLELLVLKFIPFILAILCFLNTVLSYYGVDLEIFAYAGGVSFFTLLFLYLSSYAFKFCLYHRLPLHYVTINTFLSIYDYHKGIPLSDKNLIVMYLIIAFAFSTLTIINYVNYNNKKYAKLDNR